MKCQTCGLWLLNPKTERFCNEECQQKYHNTSKPPFMVGSSTGRIGAFGELIASADLLKRGYEVYRSVSSSASCDLMVLKSGIPLRVEVTMGRRNKAGKISYAAHDKRKYDILAIVFSDGTIAYQPEGV